jgi:hypothetical protein
MLGKSQHGCAVTRFKQEGSTMKARLNQIIWKLAVALGLVEPPRMQPIPVRAQRDAAARPRRR